MLEATLLHGAANAAVDAEGLHQLVHRLDAKGTRHHRVTPEMAREEPVSLVDCLLATQVTLFVYTTHRNYLDRVQKFYLL